MRQKYARSAMGREEPRWYYHAFIKIAERLERERIRSLATDPNKLVDVPTMLMM
jgi:hypothetical protein